MSAFLGAIRAIRGPLEFARAHPGQKAGGCGRPVPPESLPAELRERLILYGALSTPDDAGLIGVALAVRAHNRKAVNRLLEDARVGLDDFPDVEVYDWEFGGRR